MVWNYTIVSSVKKSIWLCCWNIFWMTQESLFWIHNEGNIILSDIYIIKSKNFVYWIFTFIYSLDVFHAPCNELIIIYLNKTLEKALEYLFWLQHRIKFNHASVITSQSQWERCMMGREGRETLEGSNRVTLQKEEFAVITLQEQERKVTIYCLKFQ